MKKHIVFLIFGLISSSFSTHIPTLKTLSFQKLLNHKVWPQKKEEINQKLLDRKIPLDIFNFEDKTLVGLNFSGMHLRGMDFSNGTFFKVDFSNTDLTDTRFNNTVLIKCNLIGALLFKNYRIKSNDHYELVREYSDLMKKKERAVFPEEADVLGKKADSLNNLLGVLRLDLHDKNLKNFNLIGINFQNADLSDAELQGAQLSKNLKIPDYKYPNELFEAWDRANRENLPERELYNKLVHARVDIFWNVNHRRLKQVHWQGLDLRNANLQSIALMGINLSGANFEGANLSKSILWNATLIDVKLTNTIFYEPNLRGACFSKDFTLDYNNLSDLFERWYKANKENIFEKKFYNQFVNIGLNIFKDVPNECFKHTDWDGLYLKNADLSHADLTEVSLSALTLENASLICTKLCKAHLQKITLDFANLLDTDFAGAELKSVSFKGASLENANFTKATFEDVNFYCADIGGIQLSDNIRLPNSKNESDFVNIYHFCEDVEAKVLLKIILESRGSILEST